MESDLFSVLLVTLRVALLAALLAAVPALLIAFWIARHDFRGRSLLLGVLNLPLVLPPVVIGFLLLVLLSRQGLLGSALDAAFGARVIFTWVAAAIAAAAIAFPLFVGGMRIAFEGVDRRFEDAARSLGEPPLRVFGRVTVPLAARGLVGAFALGFARCVGEFGATLMVAGNIPGKTQTLALAIHQQAEVGNDARAGMLVIVAILIGLASTWGAERLRARAAGEVT